MVVELRGKCFNATITVQKHMQHCPWCHEPTTPTTTTTKTSSTLVRQKVRQQTTTASPVEGFVLDERFELICVSVLATVCVLSAAAFTCLLIAYLRLRSNMLSRANEKTYLANLMKVDSPFARTSLQTEERETSKLIQKSFSVPWEQRKKFVHWLSSSSNETVSTRAASSNETSPKESKSSIDDQSTPHKAAPKPASNSSYCV
ncbi:unnamed protein product [Anisakis simplex]|uniref:Uncharacterized protein n=1 Tax=Anisakis simplex TaxID=6269 RepID=A0A0M3K244_ANISI|nr:unnamed protein product [Anisakis simplex]